ncbi:methyltransferase RsmF C-terminal domain-like protein [Thermodesulfatator atlanticus]
MAKKRRKKIHKDAKWPRVVSFEERDEVLSFWEKRFGIPKNVFESYLILSTSKNYWLFAAPEEIKPFQMLKVQTVGLLFTRRVSHWLKPTSTALQRFGHHATKNIVVLSPAELDRLRRERKMPFIVEHIEEGYVILKCGEKIWGCGLYAKGSLISFLP